MLCLYDDEEKGETKEKNLGGHLFLTHMAALVTLETLGLSSIRKAVVVIVDFASRSLVGLSQ